MNILAEKSKYNLIETDNDWLILDKSDGHEVKRYSKIKSPLFPIAAITKWGYKAVNQQRLDEIMQNNKTA